MACTNYDYNCRDCVDAWELERLYSCYEAAHPLTTLKILFLTDNMKTIIID